MDLMSRFDRPGRSANRTFKELAKGWKVRVFGRRTPYYFATIYVLLLLLVAQHPVSARWEFALGGLFGATLIAWLLLPHALLPEHIARWERGAFGEESTAKELRQLKREGWTVRHDVSARYGNRDHVVAGGAVFLLDSKNFSDSSLTIEGEALRVRRLDSDDSYLNHWVAPKVKQQARRLQYELREALGFGTVYPVAVLWCQFDEGETYIGSVAIVRGDRLSGCLRRQPTDLIDPLQRNEVASWVRGRARA
jgi:Nuclease-related domain.